MCQAETRCRTRLSAAKTSSIRIYSLPVASEVTSLNSHYEGAAFMQTRDVHARNVQVSPGGVHNTLRDYAISFIPMNETRQRVDPITASCTTPSPGFTTKNSLTPEICGRRLILSTEPTIPWFWSGHPKVAILFRYVPGSKPEDRKTAMASIGDVSVSHIASSLAQNIATSGPATPGNTAGTKPDASIATEMKGAFDSLLQSQRNASGRPSTDSLIAPLAPFSTPSVSGDGLMNALKEAVGAFQELSGTKQNVLQQLDQSPGMQHPSTVGDQQLAQLPSKQFGSTVGDQQLAQLPDKQHASNLGSQQLAQLSSKQFASTVGDQQLAQLSEKQHASNLGSQQLAQLSSKQFASTVGDQQLAQLSDKQHISNLGDQQLAQLSDKQRASGLGDKQLSPSIQTDGSPSENRGIKMLDQCTNFFSLLHKLVSGDQDLAAKARGVLR